mmetsp:Transcript_83898/g.251438  ORF Transcript_83898/g.251438 Transcript_83898/m.251438 type:complete len:392 (+) Transcript_83898:316-1491(+)
MQQTNKYRPPCPLHSALLCCRSCGRGTATGISLRQPLSARLGEPHFVQLGVLERDRDERWKYESQATRGDARSTGSSSRYGSRSFTVHMPRAQGRRAPHRAALPTRGDAQGVTHSSAHSDSSQDLALLRGVGLRGEEFLGGEQLLQAQYDRVGRGERAVARDDTRHIVDDVVRARREERLGGVGTREHAEDHAAARVEALADVALRVARLGDGTHVLDPGDLHQMVDHVRRGPARTHLGRRDGRVDKLEHVQLLQDRVLQPARVARVQTNLDAARAQGVEVLGERRVDVRERRARRHVRGLEPLLELGVHALLELGGARRREALTAREVSDHLRLLRAVPRVHVVLAHGQPGGVQALTQGHVDEAGLLDGGPGHVAHQKLDRRVEDDGHAW